MSNLVVNASSPSSRRPAGSVLPNPLPSPSAGLGQDEANFANGAGLDARQAVSSMGSFFGGLARKLLSPYLDYAASKGADTFIHPAREADGPSPAALGLAFKTLNFTSADGKTPLFGWYIPAAVASDRTVVLAHGFGGQQGAMVSQYASWLHAAGYNVLSFDFRNSGSSGGDQTSMGYEEKQDLKAAVDQATALGGKKIALMGVSMGGATAIEEAASDSRVTTVIDDCAFDTIKDAVEPRVKLARQQVGPLQIPYPFPGLVSDAIDQKVQQELGEPVLTADPLHAVRQLGDRPLLIIHGAADNETLPQDSINLYSADPGQQKALWMVPGAGHGDSYKVDPAGYRKRVLDWLHLYM